MERDEPEMTGEQGEVDLEARRRALGALMDLMRPAVQADGGDLVLVRADYEGGIVEVRLEGACGSCAIASATLEGGVERILKERLDWVREVRGTVDETMELATAVTIGRGGYVPKSG
jgi:Fe-S cluster biogenesis protein NfuA